MKKGAIIGKGMTSEVYEWGHDKALKLFFKKYTDERIEYEARIGRIVYDASAPSPAVFETVDVDGRKGIVFQRIPGKSMLKHIQREPWKTYYYAKQMARLQYGIHKYSTDLLPSQKERLSQNIARSSYLLGSREKIILDYLNKLPDGNCICHGDIHFNNIIVSGRNMVAVDWNSAYRGNPLGDVARTMLLVNSPVTRSTLPSIVRSPARIGKCLICSTYVTEYMKLSGADYRSIDDWILPLAAAKLKDGVPGDEGWLMEIIDRRLKKM